LNIYRYIAEVYNFNNSINSISYININKYYLLVYHNCPYQQIYHYTLNKMCIEKFIL
jgi:hypothetical protein